MPLVYVLTCEKNAESYKQIFGKLLELKPELCPPHITIDFEQAAIKALRAKFKKSAIHGCNFHFAQSIWRHIQQVGLQAKYASDADFALHLRWLLALPYVPTADVEKAFNALVSTEFFADNEGAEHNVAIQTLLGYVETTYIGRFDRRGQRKTPMFPIELWNVYALTLDGNYFIHIYVFQFIQYSGKNSIRRAVNLASWLFVKNYLIVSYLI